eukprot:s3693_g4.t1
MKFQSALLPDIVDDYGEFMAKAASLWKIMQVEFRPLDRQNPDRYRMPENPSYQTTETMVMMIYLLLLLLLQRVPRPPRAGQHRRPCRCANRVLQLHHRVVHKILACIAWKIVCRLGHVIRGKGGELHRDCAGDECARLFAHAGSLTAISVPAALSSCA